MSPAKARPIIFSVPMVRAILEGRKSQTRRIKRAHENIAPGITSDAIRCPYGQPGDLLWVRETWYSPPKPLNDCLGYAADGDHPHGCTYRKRPSIFMPRWASRLTLRITAVRVERLQEISAADSRAEGLEWVAPTYGVGGIAASWNGDPVQSYRALWESINGKGSWDLNPWVWVIEFERA
jgi:hypothetical protein